MLFGVLLGAFGCYYFVQGDIGQINDRLDSIQQQIIAPAEKPGTTAKGHRGR
jgi:hypothetical protein